MRRSATEAAIDPDRFRRVCDAFEQVIELPKAARREAADRLFSDDDEARRELDKMLAGHDSEPEFLQAPGPATLARAGESAIVGVAAGDRVGDFELVRVLGAGGMGVVWEARQLQPKRTVALKTMRAGFGSGVEARRFAEETRLLGRLAHPGIAQILAAGVLEPADASAGGLPWFAMEFVPDARSLVEFASERQLPVAQSLELMLQACDAMSHGHLRGIVHRDLKPDNLLVSSDGRVKVIDFGIARATEEEELRLTTQGKLVGTLAYMSPEQVQGDRDAIDVRTDVHALGAVLFEVLTKQLPWATDGSFATVARRIAEDEPPRASTVANGLSRELDWIVGMAMAKEPARRYQSAAELAADLRRFLAHEPLVAGPPSTAYRARKFVRRHKTLVAAFVILLLGAFGTGFGLLRALDKQAEVEAAKREVERTAARALAQNAYLERMLGAGNPFGSDPVTREVTVAEMLDAAADEIGGAFPDQPDAEAATRLMIGLTYRGQGRHASATEHFAAALAIYRELRSGPHIDIARALRLLGSTLSIDGRHDEALRSFEQAIAMHGQLDADDMEMVYTHGSLAVALMRARRFAEAERHTRTALEHAQRGAPERAETIATLTTNLAKAQRAQGNLDGAEQSYRQSIAMFEAVLPDDHAHIGTAKNNLGFALHELGRNAEAEPILRDALDILQSALPDPHTTRGSACINLAAALSKLHKPDEAERHAREAVRQYRGALGPDHASFANAVNNLAYVLCEQLRWPRAKVAFEELVEFYRRTGGEDHARVALNRAYAAECDGYADLTKAIAALDLQYADRAAAKGPDDMVVQAIVRCGIRLCKHHQDRARLAEWQSRLVGK